MVENQILQIVLPGDPEVALGAPQPVRIVEGTADAVLGEASDAEVHERRQDDQPRLSGDRRHNQR